MRKSLLVLVFLFGLPVYCSAEWRWAQDEWLGLDKVEHVIGGATTTIVFAGLSAWDQPMETSDVGVACLYSLGFWVLWEVKDAVLPWEKWREFGGEGFSYKDLVWSAVGIAIVGSILYVAVK